MCNEIFKLADSFAQSFWAFVIDYFMVLAIEKKGFTDLIRSLFLMRINYCPKYRNPPLKN